MLKKLLSVFIVIAAFSLSFAPPGVAETTANIVDNNLHDAIIGQWGEWDLTIRDSSKYKFDKFTGELPALLEIDETQSNEYVLHIQGSLWGVDHESDVGFTISAVDKTNGQNVFQDLTIHVRHFSPEEIGGLSFWVDYFVDAGSLSNGNLVYSRGNPSITMLLGAEYNNPYDAVSRNFHYSTNRKQISKYSNKSGKSPNGDWFTNSWIPNAFTIDAGNSPYHYTNGNGEEVTVPANTPKTFGLSYNYEYSRYNLADGDPNSFVNFYDDIYESIKNKNVSWKLPGNLSRFSGSTKFADVPPMTKGYVPNVELLNFKNNTFTGIRWKIVKENDTSTPVKPNFGVNLDYMDFQVRVSLVENPDGNYYEENTIYKSFELDQNELATGVLQFDFPVEIRKLSGITFALFFDQKNYDYGGNCHWNIGNDDFALRPIIQREDLPDAHVGDWYDEWIWFDGTKSHWSIVGTGRLPNGLQLDEEWGNIYGNPEENGVFTFKVRAENAAGYDEREFTLRVPEPTGVHLDILSNAHAYYKNGKSDFSDVWPGDLGIQLFKTYDNVNSSQKISGVNYSQSRNSKSELRQKIESLKKLNAKRYKKNNSKSANSKTPSSDSNLIRIKNALTLVGGEPYTYHAFDWENGGQGVDVSKGETKTFDLLDEGNSYQPTIFKDDNDLDYRDRVSFSRGEGNAFKNRRILWDFSKTSLNFSGSAMTSNLISFNDELNSAIPYIELNNQNGNVNSVNVRFVRKNNTSSAVAIGYETDVNVYFDYIEEGDDNDYWPENNLRVSATEPVNGTINFNKAIRADRIRNIYVWFARDDTNSYQWIFQNPAPYIFPDQYVEDAWYGVNGYHHWFIQHESGDEEKYPLTWELIGGNLPKGLELIKDEGSIAGIPEEIGSFKFKVKATNQFGSSTAEFTMRVVEASSVRAKLYSNIFSYFINGKSDYEDSRISNSVAIFLEKNFDENYDNSSALKKSASKKDIEYLSKLHSVRNLQKNLKALKKSPQSLEAAKKFISKTIASPKSSSQTRFENAFTIHAGRGSYSYWNGEEDIIVNAGQSATFDLHDDNWNYNPVTYYGDDEYDFWNVDLWSNNLNEVLNNRKLSWTFPNPLSRFSGETTITNFKEFDDDIVPYIEFKKDGNGNVRNVKVRIVKKSNLNQPITFDYDTWIGVGFGVYDWDDEGFWVENDGFGVSRGEEAQGEVSFNRDVPFSNLQNIQVYYSNEDNTLCYNRYFDNPAPRIVPENEGQVLASAFVNEFYDWGFWYNGLADPSTKAIISKGSLPKGIAIRLDENGYGIQGVPDESGSYTFTVKITNNYGSSEAEFTLNVIPRPDPTDVELLVHHGIHAYFNNHLNGESDYEDIWFNGIGLELEKRFPDANATGTLKNSKALSSLVKLNNRSTPKNQKLRVKPNATKTKVKVKSSTSAKTYSKALSKPLSNLSINDTISNAFTIGAGNSSYNYWAGENKSVGTGSKNFALLNQEWGFVPAEVDSNGFTYTFSFFSDNDAPFLNNRALSWQNLPNIPNNGATITNLRTTSAVLNDAVPFLEFGDEDNGNIKSIKWRFVNKNDTSEAVALNFSTWVSLYVNHKRDELNYGQYNPINNYDFVNAGEKAEGEMTLANPISRDVIGNISFFFEKDGIRYFWSVDSSAPRIYNYDLPDGKVGKDYDAYLDIGSRGEIWNYSANYTKIPFDVEVKEYEDENGNSSLHLVCKPTKPGQYNLSIYVQSDYGYDEKDFVLKIAATNPKKPSIKTKSLPVGKITDDDYSAQLELSEYMPVTWSVNDKDRAILDELGLYLNEEEGIVEGSPSKVFNGKITFTATNNENTNLFASKQIPLKIDGTAPTIEFSPSNPSPSLSTGRDYEIDILTEGDPQIPPVTLKYSGKPPSGMSLTPSDDGSSYTLSGAPDKAGTYTLKFTASTAVGKAPSKTLKLIVGNSLSITTDSELKPGTYNKSYSQALKYLGPKNVVWEVVDGSMPEGMDIVKGTFKGTPKSIGDYRFTVRLSANNGEDYVDREFHIFIAGISPKIKTSSLTGTFENYKPLKLECSAGSTPIFWEILEGTLPAGLTLNADGTITGTPEEDCKAQKITVRAYNSTSEASGGAPITKTVTLTIKGVKPVFSKIPDQKATEGVSYEINLNDYLTKGNPKIKYSWNGKTAPAPWLSISESDGVITATNPEYSKKPITVKVKAANATGSATISFKLTVTQNSTSNSTAQDDELIKEDSINETTNESSNETPISESESEDVYIKSEETESEPEIIFTGEPAVNVGSSLSVNEVEYVVIAALPEIEVAQSGQYDFELTLDEKAEANTELFWFANSTGNNSDDEIADFFDETGNEINTVPESRNIIVSPWLNAGVKYKPVIAVKSEK